MFVDLNNLKSDRQAGFKVNLSIVRVFSILYHIQGHYLTLVHYDEGSYTVIGLNRIIDVRFKSVYSKVFLQTRHFLMVRMSE